MRISSSVTRTSSMSSLIASRRSVLDLSGFAPVARRPVAPRDQIRVVSEASGFPSRAPENSKPQQRRRTGRNLQLNLKVTAETATRLAELADKRDLPFGELLKQLLDEVVEPRTHVPVNPVTRNLDPPSEAPAYITCWDLRYGPVSQPA